jgi:hypothetical protein
MTWPGYWCLPSYPSPSVGSLKVISGSILKLAGAPSCMHEPRFLEYPTGQYPITLAKCAPKNVSKQHHGTAYGPLKQSLTIPAQTLTENYCWCLDWICEFMSLQMCLLWKFSMLVWSLLCQCCQRRGLHHAAERTSGKILHEFLHLPWSTTHKGEQHQSNTIINGIVTYMGLVWRIIFGSRFDDCVYWHYNYSWL